MTYYTLGGQTETEDNVMGKVVTLLVRIESAVPPGVCCSYTSPTIMCVGCSMSNHKNQFWQKVFLNSFLFFWLKASSRELSAFAPWVLRYLDTKDKA